MTDIENRKKALALLNEVRAERGLPAQYGLPFYSNPFSEALCRAIEQHEAFREEVSDALREWGVVEDGMKLSRFIIAKPDPLVEAWREAWPNDPLEAAEKETQALRAAIAKRGGKIVWEDER